MTLTETEVGAVKAVLQEFLSKKKPMERKPLLLKAKSREVLDRLVRWGILKTDDQKTYLPTALSFHYGQDPEALLLARQSITILGQVLKTLYERDAGDRRFRSDEVETQARVMFKDMDGHKIGLGLYLAHEFNLLLGWSGNPPITPIENIRISESVIELESPETLWDQHIKQRVQWIEGQAGRSIAAVAVLPEDSDTVADSEIHIPPIESPSTSLLRPTATATNGEGKHSWVPKGWKIVDSLARERTGVDVQS